MFGMSLPEILVIAIIAVLFLGPDKLPSTMVQVAKFLKSLKKTVNDVKSSFDQEMKIQELKEDAKKYKESLTQASDTVRKKLTFEELDAIKNNVNDVGDLVKGGLNDAKNSIQDVQVRQNLTNQAASGDKKEG
jgi:twin arginine-targeting protein translocase tatB|nr:Sec-independent protein translocase protein TatB [uncultured Campylobacter sp.]